MLCMVLLYKNDKKFLSKLLNKTEIKTKPKCKSQTFLKVIIVSNLLLGILFEITWELFSLTHFRK